MADLPPQRPDKIRTIPFKYPGGKAGHADDLNDVVRQILWDQKDKHFESWTEAAQHLGITQQTLEDFLRENDPKEKTPTGKPKRPKGMSLHTLSKIVATRAHGDPVHFFQEHDRFRRSRSNVDRYKDIISSLDAMNGDQVEYVGKLLRAGLRTRGKPLLDLLRTLVVLVADEDPPKKR